jgi:formylmethanofuran:tetrahydromethanopterin formyltransferase
VTGGPPLRTLCCPHFQKKRNTLSFLFTNIAIMFGDSYTERKIDFVTGHTGSNIWDITQVTLVAPVCRNSFTLGRISQANR